MTLAIFLVVSFGFALGSWLTRDRPGRSTLVGSSDPNLSGLKKYASRAMAKASVVTARNSPRMRSAGRPTSSAASAPAPPAANSARNRSVLPSDNKLPATTAPTPTNAN